MTCPVCAGTALRRPLLLRRPMLRCRDCGWEGLVETVTPADPELLRDVATYLDVMPDLIEKAMDCTPDEYVRICPIWRADAARVRALADKIERARDNR